MNFISQSKHYIFKKKSARLFAIYLDFKTVFMKSKIDFFNPGIILSYSLQLHSQNDDYIMNNFGPFLKCQKLFSKFSLFKSNSKKITLAIAVSILLLMSGRLLFLASNCMVEYRFSLSSPYKSESGNQISFCCMH